ncbi:MAG TPA: hypothetical protein VNL13_09350 [Sulfolobales archaeon]|nr:hypothetical protein [Sulfolobales archaeon]
MSSSVSVIITHTDIDGIGSAAAYIRLRLGGKRYVVIFTEPEDLEYAVEEAWDLYGGSAERVVITDLSPNANNAERIGVMLGAFRNRGVEVEWYDHHVWDENVFNSLSRYAKIKIDRSTCATGVVASASENRDRFIESLISAVCSIDLWRFSDPLSPWLLRISIYRRDDLWRRLLLNLLISSQSIEDIIAWGRPYVEKLVDKELRLYNQYWRKTRITRIDGVSLASVVKRHREISASQLAHYILSISNSDIALIINPAGPLSLRSRKCDVRLIALKLGGGGHKPAAGAFIGIPIIYKLLYRFRIEKPLHDYVLSRVNDIVKSTGCVRIDLAEGRSS